MDDELTAVLTKLEERAGQLLDDDELERQFAEALERARAVTPRPRRRPSERLRGRVLPTARRCVVCGGEFTAKRIDARYCKPRCRMRAYRTRRH